MGGLSGAAARTGSLYDKIRENSKESNKCTRSYKLQKRNNTNGDKRY